MFKDRSLQVKVVKDDGTLVEGPSDHFVENTVMVSESVIRVVEKSAETAMQMMVVYMALDTCRKVCITLAAK
jgi:hypothetical protein